MADRTGPPTFRLGGRTFRCRPTIEKELLVELVISTLRFERMSDDEKLTKWLDLFPRFMLAAVVDADEPALRQVFASWGSRQPSRRVAREVGQAFERLARYYATTERES